MALSQSLFRHEASASILSRVAWCRVCRSGVCHFRGTVRTYRVSLIRTHEAPCPCVHCFRIVVIIAGETRSREMLQRERERCVVIGPHNACLAHFIHISVFVLLCNCTVTVICNRNICQFNLQSGAAVRLDINCIRGMLCGPERERESATRCAHDKKPTQAHYNVYNGLFSSVCWTTPPICYDLLCRFITHTENDSTVKYYNAI